MKRTHKEVMLAVLKALNDNKEHSYRDLERKVNTNWQTIRDHCEILELFDAIGISKENRIKITQRGIELSRNVIN